MRKSERHCFRLCRKRAGCGEARLKVIYVTTPGDRKHRALVMRFPILEVTKDP
jgi:hypothetical protein